MKFPYLLTRLSCIVSCLFLSAALLGCPPPPRDAIAVSNTELDFEMSTIPLQFFVWNSDASLSSMTVTVAPTQPWIEVNPRTVTSRAPSGALPQDRQVITVHINRALLPEGRSQASINLSAPGVERKSVTVRVTQDADQVSRALNIINPVFNYTAPYLVDMHFSLRDENNVPVVAEPIEFQVVAQEGATPLPNPVLSGLHLKRAAARQLRANLVLDYSFDMQNIPGATTAMQNAAKNRLLPALNEDAQVGVWEFHRDDASPSRVADFTVDRAHLRREIDGILTESVRVHASGSRVWDALVLAAEAFPVSNPQRESRYIMLFSNGNNTSSLNGVNDVIRKANDRGISIYALAFGQQVNELDLRTITSLTGGQYFAAAAINQVDAAIRDIVLDLDGQYNLRWHSLRRDNQPFLPFFSLTLNDKQVHYTAPAPFRPSDHVGLLEEGRLHLAASEAPQKTTAFLRASYVPRGISQLRLFVRSEFDFSVHLVDAAQDGLFGGGNLGVSGNPQDGMWIELSTSNSTALPFATFGPILRFDFSPPPAGPTTLFDNFSVDNSVYGAGQFFVVQGFDNELPEE